MKSSFWLVFLVFTGLGYADSCAAPVNASTANIIETGYDYTTHGWERNQAAALISNLEKFVTREDKGK